MWPSTSFDEGTSILPVEDVAEVGEHPVGVHVHAVAVLVQVAAVTGMYFAAPVVPLVVANISGLVGREHVRLAARVRSMYGSSVS